MEWIAKVLIGAVALEHVYILWLEMFAWTTRGRKAFGGTPEYFASTKVLAANQGLYNGFLAAGLIWSLVIRDEAWSQNIACFFLLCVFAAGLYGGMTASRRIFFVQALPALVGLGAVLFWM